MLLITELRRKAKFVELSVINLLIEFKKPTPDPLKYQGLLLTVCFNCPPRRQFLPDIVWVLGVSGFLIFPQTVRNQYTQYLGGLVCLKFSCSRILLVARRNIYFSTMGEESGSEFDFDKWSEDHKLNRKTTGILRGQDLDKLPALMLREPEDLLSLGLTIGQRRLSLSAVKKLQEEHKEHDVPIAQPEDHGADNPPEDGQDDPVVLMTDGKTFDQLHVFDEPPFEGATGKPAGHITHFDPRHILTTKAHTTKALHITPFVPS